MRVKVTIPNDLSEITLRQYQKFLKIQEQNENESFLASKMMEIFCGIKLGDAMKMRATDVNRITSILADMFEQKPNLVQKFKMNGIEYGFIPNLDNMSLGEYVDLDNYLSKWESMEYAMAVLYRPITNKLKDKYTIEEYKAKDQDIMKDMPMNAVISSMLFFYCLGIDLSRVMMNYLEQEEVTNLHLTGQFATKWGWYQSIYALAQGDITRVKHITKLNLHECLYMLSFMKDKADTEARQIKNKIK